MKKQQLQKLFSKAYLSGCMETSDKDITSIRAHTLNSKMNLEFIGFNKDIVGFVHSDNIELENGELVIYDIGKFIKLINLFTEDITLTEQTRSKISLTDSNVRLDYTLADAILIPKVPKITVDEFELSFNLTPETQDLFIRSYKASDSEVVSIVSESNETQTLLTFILGGRESYSNKISFSIPCNELMGLGQADISMDFNSRYIKEIFSCNSNGNGYINAEGLMKLVFEEEDINSEYFLVAK